MSSPQLVVVVVVVAPRRRPPRQATHKAVQICHLACSLGHPVRATTVDWKGVQEVLQKHPSAHKYRPGVQLQQKRSNRQEHQPSGKGSAEQEKPVAMVLPSGPQRHTTESADRAV
mmetsp:Transcript_114447/g.227757  ORF Transcript_114447/g.227757 Transcript_114447/m.227757 type:complete len:115 (-) Transcript_114447:1610-1954(-)